MKFDLYSWSEKRGGTFEARQGRLQILLSRPAAVFLEAQGVQACAGYGASFDLEIAEAVKVTVDGPRETRCFVIEPEGTSVVAEGEVYTNIDRMPDESGSLAEVLRARRMLEMERRQMVQQIRAEREALLGEVRGARKDAREAREAQQAQHAAQAAAGEGEVQK